MVENMLKTIQKIWENFNHHFNTRMFKCEWRQLKMVRPGKTSARIVWQQSFKDVVKTVPPSPNNISVLFFFHLKKTNKNEKNNSTSNPNSKKNLKKTGARLSTVLRQLFNAGDQVASQGVQKRFDVARRLRTEPVLVCRKNAFW